MELTDYLKTMVEKDGSDLYLSTGAAPSFKTHGKLVALDPTPLALGRVAQIANDVMDEQQRADFVHRPEMNLAYSLPGIGRFRVNIFRQRNEVSMVIRSIKTEIPSYDSLGLPEVLTKLIMQKRGLILFVGATGSGKSTSLAALIDYRNSNSSGHIITIEDPVEFVHRHKRCIINQREVGSDTLSYEDALANTLRQAPDVILIGEIRHRETMEHALAFAETGHLCLSTLHANNANQAIERIINFFPEERHKQVLNDLSLNMRGIISQRLIPTVDGKRAAAIEILIGTPLVQDLIKKGEVGLIKEVMEKSENVGMQTFDMALFKHWREGRVSMDEALKNADSKNNLKLKMTLAEGKTAGEDPNSHIESPAPSMQAASARPAATPAPPPAAKPSFTLALEPTEEEKKDDPVLTQPVMEGAIPGTRAPVMPARPGVKPGG
ncbi:PilT/PilU family type 4a pilus ATPase [Permianibacter sp. IMCC34836]|uniref:PilT/PilU family type 4a pilus ATPase n=1 Tax=Permianibacter fluminis TaxID=2738515 RepID=UPI0015561241|nr:PilT/PilU family type 4a pilus ATPase [Permianibacter fluminis]NQD35450.1 PilT/PilU family type 4a pilus ATPase [Permianibacter fluminis]